MKTEKSLLHLLVQLLRSTTTPSFRTLFLAGLFCLGALSPAQAWNMSDLSTGTNYITTTGTFTNRIYYNAYTITNDTATIYSNIWVSLGAFTNGATPNIMLGVGDSKKRSLGTFAGTSAQTVFYCLQGTNSATSATNELDVYSGDPDNGGVLLSSKVFTNNFVLAITISVNGNQNAIQTNYLSTTTPHLGGTISVTTIYNIGADIKAGLAAFYPAVAGSWDASTFSLISNTIAYTGTNYSSRFIYESTGAEKSSPLTNVATFRINGTRASSTTTSAGGYFNTGGSAAENYYPIGTTSVNAIPAPTSTVVLTNFASVTRLYTNTVAHFTNTFYNNGSDDVKISELVCTLPPGFIYAGNPTFTNGIIGAPSTNAPAANNYQVTFSEGYWVKANSSGSLVFDAIPTNAVNSAGNVTNRTVAGTFTSYGLISTNQIDTTYVTTDNAKPTVSVSVLLNPTASNDSYAAVENTTLNVSAAAGVLANDTEPNFLPVGVSAYTAPVYGTVTVTNNGGFAYLTTTTNLVDSFTYTLTNSDGRTATATVNLTVTAMPSAGQSTVIAASGTVTADGSTTTAITVTLKDPGNHPVAGKTVTLTQTAGSGSPTITTLQGVTDSSGVATFTVKSTTVAADTFTATDTTDSVTVTQTATVNFTAGPATKLIITSSPVTTAAGVASTSITVQRQDQFGNPNSTDATRTLTLASDSSGAVVFNPASPLTIPNGSSSVSFTYTDSKVGTPTITVSSTSPSTITPANQQETITKPVPAFSGLVTSPAVSYGTTNITLGGTLSAPGPIYPASGETITVTINGNAQTTTINDVTGDFSFSYNPSTIPYSASGYTITYSYAGDANLGAASNTGTTLAVNKLAVSLTGTRAYDGTTNVAFGILTVTNKVGSDDITVVSGAGGLAAANVGQQAITSFGTLTLGGAQAVDYTLTGAGGTVTITNATPTLSVSNSSVTYNGAAQMAVVVGSVTGTVSNVRYNGSLVAPTNAGTYAITADFVPTDTNYSSLTGASAGTFVINPATPSVVVTVGSYTFSGSTEGPNSVTTPSSGAVTFSYVGVSGTTYGPSATPPTLAGSYTVTATVAADANYTSASSSPTAFTITKATPVITWNNPADIAYGTALSSVQLNSTAGGVAGSFVYSPPSGTVLSAGANQTLTMQFTPTDTADYNTPPLASATINVNQATPSGTFTPSANPAGYKSALTFTDDLPASATGSVVFETNGVPFSTNTLSGGSATGGPVSGLPRATTNVVSAIYSGDGNYLSTTNTLIEIVTNHPPTATAMIVPRTAGLERVLIALADVATNFSDVDGDPVTMSGINLVSTNGMTAQTNNTWILYNNTSNVNDQLTYSVADGQGGTNIGYIQIVINPFVTGQQSGALTVSGGAVSTVLYGIPGLTYQVQRSTNLTTWVSIQTNTVPANGVIPVTDHFSDLGGPPPSAYYRLLWQP